MAATDYDNLLVQRQFLAEQMFANPNKPGRLPRIGALAAVARETTESGVRLNTEFNTEKKQEVEVHWPEPNCGDSVADASTSCDITGTEPQSQKKTYTLTRSRGYTPIKLNKRKFETSIHKMNELFAADNLIQQKKLLEDLNARTHTFINTNANKTDITDAGYSGLSELVDPSTLDILIHPSEWTINGVFSIFHETASRLGMLDPFLITGGALNRMLYDLVKDKKAGEELRVNDFRVYMDWTMDGTLGTEKVFLIDRGVLAYLNRPDWFNTTPEDAGDDRKVWQAPIFLADTPNSRFSIGNGAKDGLPVGLTMDVDFQLGCDSRKEITESTRYILNADIVRAPDTDCDAEAIGGNPYTGIVAFRPGIVEES